MIIDFTEIPKANKGGKHQDRFELFARDFLRAIGYKIIRGPDRGADGNKDIIISEATVGIGGNETTTKWLVSCKHHAHSGKSVADKDEPNIIDRVTQHKCKGFMGVYSTLPSSGLSNRLYGIRKKVPSVIFDSARIEEMIFNCKQKEQLLLRYFPKSNEKYMKLVSSQNEEQKQGEIPMNLTESELLRITKTAQIILEVEKIKEKYWEADWEKRNDILAELNKFSDHTDPHSEREIFQFISHIASMTRARMPYDSAGSIHWAVLQFFPGLHREENKKENIEVAELCIHLGQNIAYDAFIHLRNLAIAMWGLTIIKFIYRSAKQSNATEIIDKVKKEYAELEETLRRPERNDLGEAQELLKVFKDDLEVWDLAFPPLPAHLEKRIRIDEKK